MEYSEEKFVEVLLYVAKRLEGDPSGGSLKINKAMFNADFGHMRAYGRPITGAEYQKLPHGPAPRRLLPVRKQLVRSGDAMVCEDSYLGKTLVRLVARRDPDLSRLEPSEKELLDQALAEMQGRTGTDVSEASHREPGWQMVDEGETIPYETAFLRPPVMTERIRNRILALAAEHGL
ncbi:MAG: Panacea domain-containing protein [Actinomycetota bacterium]|nr:Panacea domain-containing protein [Actinomycetota bacterium]